MEEKHYTGHVSNIAKELDDAEKVSVEALLFQGLDVMTIRNMVRLSKLVRNIVDTWYRERIYSSNRPRIL